MKLALLQALQLCVLITANTPDHCYDFTSNTVLDSCGNNPLTRHEGNHQTPDCGAHGCSFSFFAFFYAPVPAGISTTYTIGLWSQSDTSADLQLYQKSSSLRKDSPNGSFSLSIASEWDSTQWVYVYLFSDASNNRNGFGAYVPTVGSNYFEQSTSGVEDLSSFAGSSGMKIGVKASGYFPNSFVRYMVIFTNQAIYSQNQAAMKSLLASIKCPNLVATETPACSSTYVHYILTSQYSLNQAQQLIDTSGNLRHATNGQNTSVDSNDCVVQPDGTQFTGTCHLSISGLNISSRGFSFELYIQLPVSTTSTTSYILKETDTNSFSVSIQPSTKTISISIVAEQMSVVCASLSTSAWVKIAFSFISNASSTQCTVFCNFQMLQEISLSQNFDFSLNNFSIGSGFTGRMRNFAVLQNALGRETFSIPSQIPLCDPAFYFDLVQLQCSGCPELCTSCSSNTLCSACQANASVVSGVCICNDGFYKSGSLCVACDSLCDTCLGGSNMNCLTCAAGALLIQGTSECVLSCPTNYYQISNTCDSNFSQNVECSDNCETCSGPTSSECTLCSTSFFLDPTSQSCTTSCPSSYFSQISNRRCQQCHQSCNDCTGPQSTHCTSCSASLTLQPDNSCACPSSQFFHISTLTCQACSSNCLTCEGSASICTSCLPGQTLVNGECICPNTLLYDSYSCDCFFLTPEPECIRCGNGIIDPGENCDDANLQDNDGCSGSCQLESGFLCSSAPLPTRCSFISTLKISNVTFASTPSEITVTVHLSSPVYVSSKALQIIGLTLSDLSIITSLSSDPQISFQEIISSRISSLSFTLDPQASVPSNSAIQVTINSMKMTAIEDSVMVPS